MQPAANDPRGGVHPAAARDPRGDLHPLSWTALQFPSIIRRGARGASACVHRKLFTTNVQAQDKNQQEALSYELLHS